MTRRTFGCLAAAGALSRTLGANAASPIFPFGTHVYREPHLPLDELRADFPVLKRLGFTMVKIQESWSADEKKEGEIDLSNVARVVSDARQSGLQVYFGVTMEQAPMWLWKKFPAAVMLYENGEGHNDPTQYLLPADGKPGPCWHHPGARDAGIRFVEAVGREIGKFDNIAIWNVFQEIGVWPLKPGHLGVCYCPNTLEEFRKWLKAKYASLDRLNAAWRTSFGTWEEVEPPRNFGPVPSMLDWRYFMDDVYLVDVLRWKAEALRRSDPGRRPVMAHMSSPTIGRAAEWRYAEVLDVFGSSTYPSWGELPEPAQSSSQRVQESPAVYHQLVHEVLLKFDYTRSASRDGNFWVAELQGGRAGGGVDPERVPDAGDIRRWTLGGLAAGARGICFWNHRTEPMWTEGHGFGLLQMRGESTPRAEEAGKIGKALQSHVDLFTKGVCPPASVGIIVEERLWHFLNANGGGVRERQEASIRGIYQALWEEGIPVDFLDAARIPADAAQYKAVIFPYPILLAASTIEALQRYVRAGGSLIAEACAGRFDNDAMGVPGEMPDALVELFGCTHKELMVLRDNFPGVLLGVDDLSGQSILPSSYLQFVEPKGARVVLRYNDDPVGTVNDYGQGKAWLIGTLIGRAVVDDGDSPNRRYLADMLKRAGVRAGKVGRLQRRVRVHGNKTAWFLCNTTHDMIVEMVSTKGFRSVTDLLGGPLKVEEDETALRVGPMDIRCLILEN